MTVSLCHLHVATILGIGIKMLSCRILQIKVNRLIQCYVLDSSLLMPRALKWKCWNWEYYTWTNKGKLNDSTLCPQYQCPVTIQGQNPMSQSPLCVICSSSQILASYPGHMGGGKVLFFPCVAWVQGYTNTLNRGEHHWKKAILRTSLWWSVHVPDNLLNLLLPLGVNALSVLWSHEHGSKAEGRPLESWPVTLNHSGSEDGHNV